MGKFDKVYYSQLVLCIEVFTLKGKISKYLTSRGYGFINVKDSEKDIFFHMSNYPARAIPVQDQMIEFEVKETPKGKEAVNIKIVVDGLDEEPVEEVAEVEPVAEEPVEVVEQKVSETHSLNELSGVGPKYKALLEKAGINTCEELAGYKPDELLANLLSVNEKEEITKRPPNEAKVTEWVEMAVKIVA